MMVGVDRAIVDAYFEHNRGLEGEARTEIWRSVDRILTHGPIAGGQDRTGIAIGYVQSGKTTSFTALIAEAADQGYRVIVAMLRSSNLLLEQNRSPFLRLSIWTIVATSDGSTCRHRVFSRLPTEIKHYLNRGRVVLITVLKHYSRILDVASVLTKSVMDGYPVLVVDDEADQVSLNGRVRTGGETATYASIRELRSHFTAELYIQYTATPYAPLLLEVEDFLSPDFVELLHPGAGYVGGSELLVERGSDVMWVVTDGPAPKAEPSTLPLSLSTALTEFFAGAALLLAQGLHNAPVSMLVHPTGMRDPQKANEFLIEKQLGRWRSDLRDGLLPANFAEHHPYWSRAAARTSRTSSISECAHMLSRRRLSGASTVTKMPARRFPGTPLLYTFSLAGTALPRLYG